MAFEYCLHDVGEGIDAAEVVDWHVAVGDEVKEDQPLADVQTDKAVVMIPCPTDGVVLELRWQLGDMVPVGEVLAVFGERAELGGGGPAPA
ncbi:MAG: 2-oxo acid dehydrogenase subunit E2, partial [Solirubrobacterales bacterium]|nr:2-oxo acid dehydrogenase subunit E2 [Solirubrobacterales bacterium]